VNTRLIEECHNIAQHGFRRVAITGATGFIGSHLARTFAEAGISVVGIGRNWYQTSRSWHPLIEHATGDITNARFVSDTFQDVDLVYHAAALSKPWATPKEFEENNVTGTKVVIDACKMRSIRRLVFVSSTSVAFSLKDHTDIAEEDISRDLEIGTYGWSKLQAEEIIANAVKEGVNCLTIRPRAVFGPGDKSLLPRLIASVRNGKAIQIGDGNNSTDITYIDNVIYALLLAGYRGPVGSTYTITNDCPILLWPHALQFMRDLGVVDSVRQVPRSTALRIAYFLERIHRFAPWLGEPQLTRYIVGLLAFTQTFDISAAKADLGYRPLISIQEGLQKTADTYHAKLDQPATKTVDLLIGVTGSATSFEAIAITDGEWKKMRFPSTFSIIVHENYGVTLFDTGYSPRYHSATSRPPYSIYQRSLQVECPESFSAAALLQQHGISTSDVKRIIISHFHADHVAGLRDFPQSEFIVTQRAWDDVKNTSGIRAMMRAFVPSLLPDDFEDRVRCISTFEDPGFGAFPRTHDLFGDETIRLVDLSGHAAGMLGALLTVTGHDLVFLIADAAYSLDNVASNTPPHRITSLFDSDRKQMIKSLDKIHQLTLTHPHITIVPTHCPACIGMMRKRTFGYNCAEWQGEKDSYLS
jgi:nucleoside-diphosphate-sugar epimerase/glyoxylase-like metal-dependent hydrolase (beta-lactamase superfamily II)